MTSGTGRWEPFGNPEQVAANFGSLAGLKTFLDDCAIGAISSWFYDPQQRFFEHLTPPLSPLVAEDVPAIVEKAIWFAQALQALGGSVLVVRAAPSAGDADDLTDEQLRQLADTWSAVGAATAQHGVKTALHVDFLSSLRTAGALDRVLELSDAAAVGLAVDTAELTVAGIDPAELVRRFPDRIWHVQFKDALALDEAGEYRQPHAEYSVRQRGGVREIPRWFAEPGVDGGLVNFGQVHTALTDIGYSGWVVFESDQSPHPATSALLGGYFLQTELLGSRPRV